MNAMRADIAEDRYTVLETCPDLIEDYQRWDGNVRHRHKDGLDGVRYGRSSPSVILGLEPTERAKDMNMDYWKRVTITVLR